MQLQKLKTKWVVVMVSVVIVLIFGALIVDYLFRYYGPPLSREEALRRATAQLQYFSRQRMTGGTVPVLAEEQYDSEKKTWVFTFRNANCEIAILADRRQGTEVGGMTKGCDVR
jgi:hypothetical protein